MLKKSIRAIAFCLLAAVVLSGCSQSPKVPSWGASETAATAATAGPVTEPATTEPAATEPAATEPAVTEPSAEPVTEPPAEPVTEQPEPATEDPEPVRYDEASRTYLVTGADGYESLIFPAAENAGLLQADDDEFTVIAELNLLRRNGIGVPDGLPAFLARCDSSLAFLRAYLRENLDGAYPEAADLPVKWQFRSSVQEGIKKSSARITLNSRGDLMHREFYYLTTVMEKGNIGWEQLGYAWYVSSILDPYSELQRTGVWDPASDALYAPLLRIAGLDSGTLSPAQFRTFYDAVARYCFEHGLDHWGAICESSPITAEPVYSRVGSNRTNSGDDDLSAFMAASFVAWLDEQHGPAPLARFVFGQNTFEESFGTDYDTAFGAWKEWIIEQYPLP